MHCADNSLAGLRKFREEQDYGISDCESRPEVGSPATLQPPYPRSARNGTVSFAPVFDGERSCNVSEVMTRKVLYRKLLGEGSSCEVFDGVGLI